MRAPFITDIMHGHGLAEYETRYINVKDPPFRARGNGVVDDTAAIQAAINAGKNITEAYGQKTGCVIYFPIGVYRITSPLDLTVNCGISLCGEGKTKSNLIYYGAGGTCMLDYANSNNYRGEIRGMRLGGDAGMTRDCIDIPTAGNQIYVLDCWICNWENAIHGHPFGDGHFIGNTFEYVRRPFCMDTCVDMIISHNILYNCGHAGVGGLQNEIMGFDTCKRVQITHNRFVNDALTANLKALILLTDCEHIIIADNIEYDGADTVFNATVEIAGASKHISLHDNHWGESEFYTIKIGGTSQYITVRAEHLQGTDTPANPAIFADSGTQHLIIVDNTIKLKDQNYDISCGIINNAIIRGNILEGNLHVDPAATLVRLGGNDIAGTCDYLVKTNAWNPGNIAVGAMEAFPMTVNGARFGDLALAALDVDLQDLQLDAQVVANNTVVCTLYNNTAGAVNVDAGNVHVEIFKNQLT